MITSKTESVRMKPVDAAAYLGCSVYTLRDQARRGLIPSYHIGNRVMFNKNSLDRWIEAQERQSSTVA